jgi:hypothetical protein
MAIITVVAALSLSGCGGGSSPVGVSVSAAATSVDGNDSVTLTATVSNDKNSAGVTWSVSGGGTLSNSTTSSVTYTAPAPSSSALNVTVTATSVADTSKTAAVTLTVPPTPTATSVSSDLAGSVGTAYSVQLKATGGIAPYTWTLTSGTLPACLTMTPAGLITSATAVTASCVSNSNLTFTMTDSGKPTPLTATLQVNLVINAATPITFSGVVPATATYNVAYSGSAAATGGAGALTYTKSGTWPTWLSLSPTTGSVSGTPSATGTFNFTVQAADAFGDSNTQQYTVVVSYPPMNVTATTLPVGYIGSVYKQTTLTATGGTGVVANYTWAATGSLPAGISLSSSGVLSGTPTGTPTTSTFSVTATDTVANLTSTAKQLSITVDAGITINSVSMPTGYVGSLYTQTTLTASGGAGAGTYTWSWIGNPAGLTLNASTGAISGTPTTQGTFNNIKVTVTDTAQNTATTTLSVTIDPGITINSVTLPAGYLNAAYPGATFTATGGSGTYTKWTWTGNPAGMTLNQSTGVVGGTPSAAGSFNVAVTVTDNAGNTGTTSFPLTVEDTLKITSTSPLPSGTVGGTYSQQLVASGGAGPGNYSWSTDTAGQSSLSTVGLSLSSAGVVSGTNLIQGNATFTATVSDTESHSAQATFTVAVNTISITPSSLPVGYTGTAYLQNLTANGGTGPYTWLVTNGNSSLTALGVGLSSGGVLSSPTALTTTGSASFTVQVTDHNNAIATASYTLVVYNPLQLPSTNPSTLPSTGTTGVQYNGTIGASGGSGNYSWTVTGLPFDNLSASPSGGTLTITGIPNTVETVTFTAKLTDTSTNTSVSQTYNIQVNAPGSQVSGKISLNNYCGGGSNPTMPAITVTIINTSTNQTMTATTDTSGNYSFASVPAGTWTITPSYSGTGISSVFYPTSQSVTLSGTNTNADFGAAIGYTVSGTASYSGPNAGRIYLTLLNNNCGGNSGLGTSIPSSGPFTIRGVPPGSWDLIAQVDNLGFGSANDSNPIGEVPSVPVSTTVVTGVSVPISDVAPVTLTTSPTFKVSAADQGAFISYKPIVDSQGIEEATSYNVQWSTSSTFGSITSSKTFPATGAGGTNVWVLSSLTNAQTYYFRVQGVVGTTQGPWSSASSAVTIGAPAGANTITGTVTFTGTATGPLYVGFFDQSTNKAYATHIATPVSPQSYTVQVPTGTSYYFFGIIDQNNDGIVDSGDITNTHDNGASNVSISSSTTENLTLPSTNSTATVATQHWQQTTQGGSAEGYNLTFDVKEHNKLPVSVELISGPNVVTPVDMGRCEYCGSTQFMYNVNVASDRPTTSDTYSFTVKYSDGNTETLSTTVSAVLDAFATNLAPSGSGAGITPTFSWTDPANASTYTYQFSLNDNNGNTIWQIPGSNSNSSGFDSSITTITWGTDPTGGGSAPSIPSLNSNTTYNWMILVQDSNGNSAQSQVYIIP